LGDIIKKKARDGRFLGWYIRYVDETGVRRQRASRQPTQALARKLLIEVEAEIARRQRSGAPVSTTAGPATVAELFDRFLSEYRSPKIKDLVAYRRDARLALNRLRPTLGATPLARLDRRSLERTRDELCGRYRPNTVRSTLRPLGAALSWAVRENWIANSPVRGVELPRAERSLERLTSEEAAALLRVADELAQQTETPIKRLMAKSRHVAIALALRLGLRRGEVFGLRWIDLDLAAGRVTIARSYGGVTKSGRARHIPLTTSMVELLQAWREECPATKEELVCPVYSYGQGWKLSARGADAGLYQIAKAAGVRRFARGWHCLRHSMASTFVQNGGSLYALQLILGHTSPTVTQIYAHLAPDYLAREMERVKF